MTREPNQRRFRDLPGRLARHRGGLAAIEFAFLLPLMLLIYLGSFEITSAVAVQRLVTLTASTVANVVTQYASISQSQVLPDIFSASTSVLTPYPAASAKVTVSDVQIDGAGNATISWSRSSGPGGTGRVQGSAVALPAAFRTPNTQVVWGETTYTYTPTFDFLHIGTLNLYSSVYMLPRSSSGQITLVP
jgi:Flp pilus assembly protein TadG